MSDWTYFLSVDVQNESNLTTDEWLVMAEGTENGTVAGGDQSDTALDLAASLLVGIFLAVVIFLSVAGNLLVCIAVYTDRTLRKVGNLFIVSLAISDLFVACLVMVFAVANDLQGFWVFGDQFCDIWVAFDVMCCTASILNLCAISMDRYIHIKDPLRYGRWMTKRVIYGSIAAIWLLAALISFLPVSMDLHKPQDDGPLESFDGDVLDSDFASSDASTGAFLLNSETDGVDAISMSSPNEPQCALDLTPTYAIVSSCISFYLPCLVMLAIYSRLFFYAKMHVQNIKAVTRPVIQLGRFEPDPSSTGAATANDDGHQKKTKKKRRHQQATSSSAGQNNYHVSDHKAAITLGIIMGVFLICWVPFFCVNIVAAFCKTCIPPIVFKILTWLGYSNSAFNPIIYSIFNLDFRLAFQKILTVKARSFCCRRFPDYEQRSRGNSNGTAAALGSSGGQQQPGNQFRMDNLRQQQQQVNGQQHRPQGNDQHFLAPNKDQLGQVELGGEPNSDDAQSVILVSASSSHIITANSIKPHIRNINSSRQDSGQHLLIAEKVV